MYVLCSRGWWPGALGGGFFNIARDLKGHSSVQMVRRWISYKLRGVNCGISSCNLVMQAIPD